MTSIRQHWREIGVACAVTVGWLLILWGLSNLLTVWTVPIGIGLALILTFGGYRWLWVIISTGLYTLSQDDSDGESD